MLKLRRLPTLLMNSLGLLSMLFSVGCGLPVTPTPRLPTTFPSASNPTRSITTVNAAQPSSTPVPTTQTVEELTSPTQIPPSATRSSTFTPTSPPHLPTFTQTRIPPKTLTPTATPTIPLAEIQFSSPGQMSKVVSPLELNVYYRNVPNGHMLVELLAEPLVNGDPGRLLVSKLQRFVGGEAYWLTFQENLDFEISRVSEFAVLRFGTYDSTQRPVAVSSIDLLLLSLGVNELNPRGNLLQPVVIYEPAKNKLIQGGVLTVSGVTRPEGDKILHFELLTQDKQVVGMHDLFTTPAEDGKHIPYSATINYQVSAATWVRLIAYYLDPRIPGYRQLTSVPILLSP